MCPPTVMTLSLKRLRRSEMSTFMRRVLVIVEQQSQISGAFVEAFRQVAQRYDLILQAKNTDPKTTLESYDRDADTAWRGLKAQIVASLLHPDAGVVEAAQCVDELFSKTPDPTKFNFEREYGLLDTLLGNLATIDIPIRERAFVQPYIARLEQTVAAFYEASAAVNEIRAQKVVGELMDAFNACIEAWRKLVKVLEYRAEFESDEAAKGAIERLNAMLRPVKTRLSQRQAKPAEATSPDISFEENSPEVE